MVAAGEAVKEFQLLLRRFRTGREPCGIGLAGLHRSHSPFGRRVRFHHRAKLCHGLFGRRASISEEDTFDLVGNVKCLEDSLQKGHRVFIFSAIAGEFPTIVLDTIPVTQITFLTRWQAEHCWNVETSTGEMVGIFSVPLVAGNYEATGLPGSCLTEELTLFLSDKPTGFPEESLWDSQRSIGHYPVQIKFPSLQSSARQSKEGNWHIRKITLTPKDFSGVDDILIRVRTSSEETYAYIDGKWISDSFIPNQRYAWEFKVLQAAGAQSREKPIEVLVKAKETEIFEVQVLCVVSGSVKGLDRIG